MQCTARTNFLHKKISYLHALQENREMSARYLDPKYSRWISTDPALGENPQRISSLSTLKSPSITMSSPFSNTKINSNSELSMNGNLETGFKLVDKYKKTSSTVTPKVYACVSAKQDGIATIDVIIEIDNYSYSGTVAYAGLSEIQTNGKDDKAKIDKIANESINFLRGTSNEIKNLTE